eukprot:scaffold109765_cov56-Attheya_sp.AAC.1
MRRQEKKCSRPPSPEKELQGSNLNISAGGVFYENARSRRERHRVVLMSSDRSSDAVPLGKSGKRGPGRTSDLPGDVAKANNAKGETGEDGAKKVRELIDAGRSMAAKSRSSSRYLNPCKNPVTPTSAYSTNSRMRIKNTQSVQSNSSERTSRQIKAQSKSNGPETGKTGGGRARVTTSYGNLENERGRCGKRKHK